MVFIQFSNITDNIIANWLKSYICIQNDLSVYRFLFGFDYFFTVLIIVWRFYKKIYEPAHRSYIS